MRSKQAKRFLIFLFFSAVLGASANTVENFNSRTGVPLKNIKASLQNACWTFHHFNVNGKGWNPQLEGDGAMVSDAGASLFNRSGIYTPVLLVGAELQVSFNYTFSENFIGDTRRWIRLCLTDATNNLVQVLENIELDGVNAAHKKTYRTSFQNLQSGEFRLVLQYGGTGGNARIAIDQLEISAPLRYDNGCNAAPTAINLQLTGMPDRSAAGNLLAGSDNTNSDQHKTYLIKGSAHGAVHLDKDGSYVFIPHNNFTGKTTSFIYKVCSEGSPALCSENRTASISFPEHPGIAATLVGLKGAYRYNGHVELAWKTSSINNLGRYVVERSLDGQVWEEAGTVNAKLNSHTYEHIDKIAKNKVLKKDLYYRLKQIDVDGSTSYSRLLILRVYNTKTVTMISITPDPAKKDIAVNLQLHENSYVSTRVLDSQGQSVIFNTQEIEKGDEQFLVKGSSKLKPGLYLLELIVNSRERMLVQLLKE